MSKFWKDLSGHHYETLEKAIYRKELGQITDPSELYLPLLAVPRALMSWAIQNIASIKVNETKQLEVPGSEAVLEIRKIAPDSYNGELVKDAKVIHRFEKIPLPTVAGTLLSVLELYDEVAGRKVEPTEKAELAETSKEDRISGMIEKLGSLIDKVVQLNAIKKDEIKPTEEPKKEAQPVIVNVTLSNIGNPQVTTESKEPKDIVKDEPKKEEPKEIVPQQDQPEEIKKEEILAKPVEHVPTKKLGDKLAAHRAHHSQKKEEAATAAMTEALGEVPANQKMGSKLILNRLKSKRTEAPAPVVEKQESPSKRYFKKMAKREGMAKAAPKFESGIKASKMMPQAGIPKVEPVKGNNQAPKLSGPVDAATPKVQKPRVAATPAIKQPKAPAQPKEPGMPAAMKSVMSVTKDELDTTKSDIGKRMFVKDEFGKYRFNPSGVNAVMTKSSLEIKKSEDGSFQIFADKNEWDSDNLELLKIMVKARVLLKKFGF